MYLTQLKSYRRTVLKQYTTFNVEIKKNTVWFTLTPKLVHFDPQFSMLMSIFRIPLLCLLTRHLKTFLLKILRQTASMNTVPCTDQTLQTDRLTDRLKNTITSAIKTIAHQTYRKHYDCLNLCVQSLSCTFKSKSQLINCSPLT